MQKTQNIKIDNNKIAKIKINNQQIDNQQIDNVKINNFNTDNFNGTDNINDINNCNGTRKNSKNSDNKYKDNNCNINNGSNINNLNSIHNSTHKNTSNNSNLIHHVNIEKNLTNRSNNYTHKSANNIIHNDSINHSTNNSNRDNILPTTPTPLSIKSSSNSDYLTDVIYTSHFYSELNPLNLSFISACNFNETIDLSQHFTFCELGCGLGETTAGLAASYPHADFYGIDINKEHIKIAQKYEKILPNLRFIEGSFHSVSDHIEALPQFDFIVMHGVWSWVNLDVQNDICKFIAKFLKNDGLFYLSYNCMAGWCDLLPIRELMLSFAKLQNGTILEKAQKSLQYLQHLKKSGALYFENQNVKNMVDYLSSLNLHYIVHEFFNGAWKPEYFGQVVSDLARIGLSYVGSSPMLTNYNFLIESENIKKLLESASDNVTVEIHKSLITKQKFRKDIFKKQSCTLINSNLGNFLQNFRVGILKKLDEINLKFKIDDKEITLNTDVYKKIIDLIYEGGGGSVWEVFCALNELSLEKTENENSNNENKNNNENNNNEKNKKDYNIESNIKNEDHNKNYSKHQNKEKKKYKINAQNKLDGKQSIKYKLNYVCECITQLIMFDILVPVMLPLKNSYSFADMKINGNFNKFKIRNINYVDESVSLCSQVLGSCINISIIQCAILNKIFYGRKSSDNDFLKQCGNDKGCENEFGNKFENEQDVKANDCESEFKNEQDEKDECENNGFFSQINDKYEIAMLIANDLKGMQINLFHQGELIENDKLMEFLVNEYDVFTVNTLPLLHKIGVIC